jgi:CRISPR-associated protein Cmr2
MTPPNLTHILHFTIGPVQGFVSQARRTRDFWAGSFLLSYLSATAMRYVEKEVGPDAIKFPDVKDDPIMQRLRKILTDSPTIATLPNHFKAEVPENFDGHKVKAAVVTEWERIADAVWDADLKGLSDLEGQSVSLAKPKEIWDRQIRHFWDISWVIVPKPADGEKDDSAETLDRRKNMRVFMPQTEYGDKCSIMGEYQELSGCDGPNRKKQNKELWDAVRTKFNNDDTFDIGKNERLCAVAFVKRRFMYNDAWGKIYPGWTLPDNVPSTPYMSAVHWLTNVIKDGDAKVILEFFESAKTNRGELHTHIACIEKALADRPELVYPAINKGPKSIADLDGGVFFKTELVDNKDEILGNITNIKEKLDKLSGKHGNAREKFGSPTPFYAVLMMDGDSFGKLLQNYDEEVITKNLKQFTNAVKSIVCENNGFLIYAGGEDVLALMPLEDALPCAYELRKRFIKAFEGTNIPATISAAINYAHMKLPLAKVIQDTHDLLSEVAKEKTGRDAVACRVWKRGGDLITWSIPWDKAVDGDKIKVVEMTKYLDKDGEADGVISSKFLYSIRGFEDLFNKDKYGNPPVLEEGQAKDVLVAKLMASGSSKDKLTRVCAEDIVGKLLDLCAEYKDKDRTGNIRPDGAMLLRFLAAKGAE